MLLLGLAAERPALVATAALCAFLREYLSPTGGLELEVLTRAFVGFLAFAGTGLFVSEQSRNRQRAVRDAVALAEQVQRRERAEEDLRLLVESSPAAIIIVGGSGEIALANRAAEHLLGNGRSLPSQTISRFLPALASVLDREEPSYRTVIECVGHRAGGETFLAHMWFSTYRTRSGPRLAAIIHDASEELRDREASSLDGVLNASRIMVAAVSHEVKNLSAAAAVAHANLSHRADLGGDPDFAVLLTCIEGLQRIASSELRLSADLTVGKVDLESLLNELRVLLEPQCRDSATRLQWDVEPELCPVLGDRHGILQIFLNLAQNGLKAMTSSDERVLTVDARADGAHVAIRIRDTGPGVADSNEVFRPFTSGNGGTGLGLFVSRTLARYFAGDLRIEPSAKGTCFALHLVRAHP
jgi:PAS domain S-box-containing protein